jgi:hypothetical protein
MFFNDTARLDTKITMLFHTIHNLQYGIESWRLIQQKTNQASHFVAN